MAEPTAQRIEAVIASSDVVLFMKGIPATPQCGFSAAAIQNVPISQFPKRGEPLSSIRKNAPNASGISIVRNARPFARWTIPA
jgi:hypothetical protein